MCLRIGKWTTVSLRVSHRLLPLSYLGQGAASRGTGVSTSQKGDRWQSVIICPVTCQALIPRYSIPHALLELGYVPNCSV